MKRGLVNCTSQPIDCWSRRTLRFGLSCTAAGRLKKTQVLALHMGFVDTDLASATDAPKSSPAEIVKRALDALEAGLEEVLADERTRLTKQGLTAPRPSLFAAGGLRQGGSHFYVAREASWS